MQFGGLYENVQVLRHARLSMDEDGVAADDEVAYAMGVQRGEQLF